MGDESAGRLSPRRAVAARVRRIAAIRLRMARLESELDRELDAARQRYAGRLAALGERAHVLEAELEAICRQDRSAVLPAGCKSWSTPFGRVSFRAGDSQVCVRPGLTEGDVCRLLRRSRLGRLVRVRERPDRRAIQRELADGRVSAGRLARCGLEVVRQAERFRLTVEQVLGPAVAARGEGG